MSNENGSIIKISFRILSWFAFLIFCGGTVWVTVHFTTQRVDAIEPTVFDNAKRVAVLEKGQENIEQNQKNILLAISDVNKNILGLYGKKNEEN